MSSAENGSTSAPVASGTSAKEEKKDWDEEYYVLLYGDFCDDLESKVYKKPDKRPEESRIQWEEFHMLVAVLSSMRGDDPDRKVGACIVNADNKIVGIGHNKLPDGVNREIFPYWGKRDVKKYGFMDTKYPYVCHAAIHAILNKNAESLKGCTLYTTLFPSHEDAKLIIQAGITKVVYLSDIHEKRTFAAVAKHMFQVKKPERRSDASEQEDSRECTDAGKQKILVKYTKFSQSITQRGFDLTIFPIPQAALNPEGCLNVKCPEPALHLARQQNTVPSDMDFFMALACLAARRSKDPNRQVGACIVNGDGQVVGVGYNGFAKGIDDDEKTIPWGNDKFKNPAMRKMPYVVHAEVNAIMYKTCIDLKDCTIYTTLFPCNECAKVIIQAGIKKIHYLMDDKRDKLYMRSSRQLLEMAGYVCLGRFAETPQDPTKKICQEYIPTQKFAIDLNEPVQDTGTAPQALSAPEGAGTLEEA